MRIINFPNLGEQVRDKFLLLIFFLCLISNPLLAQKGKPLTSNSDSTKNGESNFSTVKKTPSTPTQSIYYDALALYYAERNYSAFPLFSKKTTKQNDAIPTTTLQNKGPLGGPNENFEKESGDETLLTDVLIYQIIESTSGKVLNSAVYEDGLKAEMEKYKFNGDTVTKKELIDSILERNDRSQSYLKHPLWTDTNNPYSKNKFLEDPLNENINRTQVQFGSNLAQTIIPDYGKGIPTVSQLAEGLADFYIQEVNAEISDAFFIRLQQELNKFEELKYLFPNTLGSLTKLEITQYRQSINALKAAFETDVKNLLTNLSSFGNLQKYRDAIDKVPPLTMLFVACDLLSEIKKGHSAPEIISKIYNSAYIQLPHINDYNSVIKLAGAFSWSITDSRIGDGSPSNLSWLSAEKLSVLNNNPGVFRVFMGLLTQNIQGVKIGNTDIYELLITNVLNIDNQFILNNISEPIDGISKILSSQTSGKDVNYSFRVSKFMDVANQILTLSEKCLYAVPSRFTSKERSFIEKMKTEYSPILQQADSVTLCLEQKQYSSAIYHTDTLLSQIFAAKTLSIAENNAPAKQIQNKENQKLDSARKAFLQYGLFIAAVAEAASATDVKNAITAFALPKGSSRIKKENHFSWGLNGYVGVYHSWNNQIASKTLPLTEWGITAPLGIAFNWGHFAGGSFTIYGGLIDIGAVFSYKINSDSSITSKIELGQIFSPSIGLFYGLFITKKKYNIPLSIGVNYQLGPTLQKVDQKGNSVLPFMTTRINAILAVDIPIINFHVKK